MEQARDADSFLRDPVGRWFSARTTLFWCVSPALSGVAGWGRASVSDSEENVRLFAALRALHAPIDLVMDGSHIDSIDLDALAHMLDWARKNMDLLQTRIRRRIGLIPEGTTGLVLAGLSPVLGWLSNVSIAPDLRTALAELDAPDPATLATEIESILRSLQGTPALLLELRALLRARNGNVTLAEASRELGASARSLQRVLAAEGRSFRAEEQDARFEAATRLLESTDDKVSAIARRLGVTEGVLTQLVRARTGIAPSAFRERARAESSGARGK